MSQPSTKDSLPSDSQLRKELPIATGVIDYFPDALVHVAAVSQYGNDKHNPGEPLHWARGKSMDQADALMRHLIDRGKIDPESGLLHSAQLAWRALANLQVELEEMGLAELSRGSRVVEQPQKVVLEETTPETTEPGEVPLMSMEHENG